MTILVASCYMHREEYQPQPVDWPALIGLLDRSAALVGARHVCITDPYTAPSLPCETHVVPGLPEPLMRAFVMAQMTFVALTEIPGDLVLVGADCLVGKALEPAFDGTFDLAVTSRPGGGPQGLNNGAIYISEAARPHAVNMLARAARTCRTHWGGDQESVAEALHPVPAEHGVEHRHGARVAFLPMPTHNFAPDGPAARGDAYVVHFKGTRKAWMPRWARQQLGIGV